MNELIVISGKTTAGAAREFSRQTGAVYQMMITPPATLADDRRVVPHLRAGPGNTIRNTITQHLNMKYGLNIPESGALAMILEGLRQHTAGRAKMDECVTRQR